MGGTSIEFYDDPISRDKVCEVVICAADAASLNLSQADKALLEDIDNGEPSNTPMADRLLGLELIVRRIEEYYHNHHLNKEK